ncbi:unnamed protein product [Amoebophrya sp. A120]|nr:unnamed protein product [Amoebophrya sp. A120]|eukprot:GSA120T00002809001.1
MHPIAQQKHTTNIPCVRSLDTVCIRRKCVLLFFGDVSCILNSVHFVAQLAVSFFLSAHSNRGRSSPRSPYFVFYESIFLMNARMTERGYTLVFHRGVVALFSSRVGGIQLSLWFLILFFFLFLFDFDRVL